MNDFVLGEGTTAQMRGLKLMVLVTEEGWGFRIWDESREVITQRPCGPYVQRQEEAQVDAVKAALGHLESADDPLSESLGLRWHSL